ncbi:hypothetical protein Tco_1419645 [Tanacetum coccineum]
MKHQFPSSVSTRCIRVVSPSLYASLVICLMLLKALIFSAVRTFVFPAWPNFKKFKKDAPCQAFKNKKGKGSKRNVDISEKALHYWVNSTRSENDITKGSFENDTLD